MRHYRLLASFALALILVACGSPESGEGDTSAPGGSGLTQAELEKGIGPIKEVTLAADVDDALVRDGEVIFNSKCSACHKMDQRYVGPPLGDVVDRRAPEFIMNMMLNPAEMVERHPEVRAMLAQYMTPMPSQNLTEEDARALLEYLRENQQEVVAP